MYICQECKKKTKVVYSNDLGWVCKKCDEKNQTEKEI